MADIFAYDPEKDHPVAVTFSDDNVIVTLADGRTIGNPLDWHPWLKNASEVQRQRFTLRHYSVDWDDLDEGLDIQGMLLGVRPKHLEVT
jgi:hypothetical protein